MNLSNLTYIPQKLKITTSRNPADYYRLMKLYSKERKDNLVNFRAFINAADSLISRCGLRVIKDEDGSLLAAYTYKLRKNKLEQKSIYIDALARDRSKNTKSLMPRIYSDMKNIAIKKNASELTCFSVAKDKHLRTMYEKLGFRIDPKVDIFQSYLMRSPVNNFLNSAWFKLEQYKGVLGINNLLQSCKTKQLKP